MLAAFSILAVEAGAQTKSDRKKAEKIVSDGDKSFNRGDFKTAIQRRISRKERLIIN
jgi:hypothetical protein